ncbi:hypothetical protein D3C85_1283550 [compost metagenome]
MQQSLPGELVQRLGFQVIGQPALAQVHQQAPGFSLVQPVAQERQRFCRTVGQCFESKQQLQTSFASLLITFIRRIHQRYRRLLRDCFACGDDAAKGFGDCLQLIEALRSDQAQGHLSGLVKVLMKILQRLLKLSLLYRQTVAITSMKTS